MLSFLFGLAIGIVVMLVADGRAIRNLLLVGAIAIAVVWASKADLAVISGSKDAFKGRQIPEDGRATTVIDPAHVGLTERRLSPAVYGLGGYVLSGNVTNDSSATLTILDLTITVTDCRGSSCRVVGQENVSASVSVPPKQMRAFSSAAIRFEDLPALTTAKRFWSSNITGARGRAVEDQQRPAKPPDA
jgi:hypothetical protein